MTKRSPFKYFKTSPEIIRLAVMLYVRFPLSLRNVEDLLHERGIEVSHETVRYWWNRFGPMFASEIRKRRVQGLRSSRWRWHLDEMFVKINGRQHYLWRAVDHEGEVLESFVTTTRDKKAALKFLRKSMKRHGRPEEVVTDRLRTYGAALKEMGRGDDREMGRWVNNRAEGSVRRTCLETGSWPTYPRPMTKRSPFRYFKTSPEIIRLAVMLYVRFPLSLRNVEDLLHERGIDVSHETVRYWWNRFGPMFASEIRKRRVQGRRSSRWRWHLDEMFVKINGRQHYLWRAVDHEGEVLESFVTITRDKKAALKFLRKAMKRHGRPEEVVTDRLRTYGAALKEMGRGDDREMGRWVNNRAENSHLPFRRRERAMQRFRQMRCLQKFASVHASVSNHFNQERSLSSRNLFKLNRTAALVEWRGLYAG